MWLIINLNIAVDKTVRIDKIKCGSIYRYPQALTLAGGKGLNVARAARTLGINPEVWGFIGGYNGLWLKDNLKKEGFTTKLFWHNNGESRICYSFVDKKGVSTDFNEDGPDIPLEIQEKFLNFFKNKVSKFSVISISGRSPKNLKNGFYSEIVKIAKKKNKLVYVDLTGNALSECLESGVDVVKINNLEFEEFYSKKFSPLSILDFWKKFVEKGLKTIIVTNKAKPFYCCDNGKILKIIPPDISSKLKSPVGAGDSFLAGLIYSNFKNYDISKSLKFATACAVSDCFSLGAGIISILEVKKYFNKVKEMAYDS